MAFLDLALQRIPDIDYTDFFEDDELDAEDGEEEWGELPHEAAEAQIDRKRDSGTRIAEAMDGMDSDTVCADTLSDVVSMDFAVCEPLISVCLDARVRYGYEGSELARYVFEALKVSRLYELDFDDRGEPGR